MLRRMHCEPLRATLALRPESPCSRVLRRTRLLRIDSRFALSTTHVLYQPREISVDGASTACCRISTRRSATRALLSKRGSGKRGGALAHGLAVTLVTCGLRTTETSTKRSAACAAGGAVEELVEAGVPSSRLEVRIGAGRGR